MTGEIKEEIKKEYERIKDKIPYEDFLKKMDERKHDYEDVSFMSDLDIARTITGEYINEENTPLSEKNEQKKISELVSGQDNISVTGRIIHISNVKKFTSRKGKNGKLANIILADETGEIRVVLWTNNIRSLKDVEEGDIVKVNSVEVKQGFREDELQMNMDSTIKKIPEDSEDIFKAFPKYDDSITQIKDIKGDMQVNVIAGIIRIPRIRSFDKNGKDGKVASLEIQDKTGTIQYTLWNKDTNLIEDLKLKEGDSVKILGALGRERNGEISLTHSWLGRIIKGEFDVPKFSESILKIGDAHEMRNVTIIGVVCKNYDKITFQRNDGTAGQVKSVEIQDDTGSIRVTLWNDDADETKLNIKQKDILKIIGGNIEFDEYSSTGYRINTNWNSKIIINPEIDDKLKKILEERCEYIKPVKVAELNDRDDEGDEVDIVGRIVNVYDPNEFQRSDGTTGLVRTIEIGDSTGVIRSSLWDDKAEMPLKEGDPVKIENARTRLGDYMELSIGKTSRISEPTPEEIKDIPSLTEIENRIYTTKKIDELTESDRNVRLIGRIINVYDPNKFQRNDGTTGLVRTIEIGDSTGVIRSSLWDDKAEVPLKEGDPVKIENPQVKMRENRVEISIGRSTLVTKPKEDEIEKLPSFDEIKDMIYKTRKIDEIEEEDQNIKVIGQVVEAYGNKILYEMCPNCNKRVTFSDNAYICDICGEEIENPNYLMIISCVVEDDTGTMRTTFFRTAAEELIGMNTDEVRDVIEKTGDEGSLEEKVEDLVGQEITIIADASFDEYNEEIRLNAKKVLDKKL
ncbi:OB-fold nucleic acid binding domain-containing protein [Methanobacterium paludis]|uniref:Replication factor-A domain protein n=1 Tax=Methanobacterium paludis (strain DSM 25820 / JCM 18151 / SWAN1) TaxID=868131 RepID=F6D5G9_METPW|nr:OB-fold nucleic acid binding domain-containing protein [Methanobacterium paludis]AEG19321.1 Replication factor-A domain protein [Methanobacterium paludis]